jgi:4-hydroxybenzoate polyprenyltransferase
MNSRLRALRVVHPFPSLLNTALVFALSVVAGAGLAVALTLAIGMLGIQLCIGTVNDLSDVDLDARTKPWKPIPAGLVSHRAATTVAIVCGALALLAPATRGIPVVLMAATMLAAGLVYDIRLKPTVWAWACYSVAFAILPVYAWFGSVGTLPPLSEFLLPLAALAGPALQLSNGLIDLETDAAAGIQTLATRLGRTRTLVAISVVVAVVYSVAWITLGRTGPPATLLVVVVATALAAASLVLSTGRSARSRAAGWTGQAVAIALLAAGWMAAI